MVLALAQSIERRSESRVFLDGGFSCLQAQATWAGSDNNNLSELDPQNFLFILHGLDQLDAESGSNN